MVNKLFKSIFAAVLVIGSVIGFVACENEGDDVVTDPSVEVSATTLNFTNEEGNQTLDVKANAEWKADTDADWVTITPAAGKGDATITVAVAANDTGAVRSAVVKVIALHPTYGAWDTKKVTVSQSATEAPPAEEVLLYGDDFDGQEATKTFGSGSSWPYIDQFPEFANQEGPASENVTYSGKGVSVRANSTSDSQYSDYAGSGMNNIFFGSSANFQVNNITLAEGQTNLKLTFGSEKYTQDGDSTFKTSEFHVLLSKDGNAWSEIEYTFAGTEGGRWNVATADFTLTALPETLYIKFVADVASVYRLDDVKLFTGNGGQQINLENGEAPQPSVAKKVTVAEFLAAAEDSTLYELTGTITNVANTTYGNFDLTDSTGTVFIYGLSSPSGEQKYWAESGAKLGDTITVQTVRTSYNGTPQGKDAIFVSLVPGEGGNEQPTPAPAEGPYASDAPFVCSADDSTNAAYSLGETVIGGNAVTGFKLGKGKQTGLFMSGAVGVSGDKYLNLYAVAWKGGDAKLYFRVDGGATQTLEIAPNDGASNNAPYTALTFAASDHYSVKLTGLKESSTIEFSTDANFELTSADATISYARAIVCGVKLTDEPLGAEDGGNDEPAPTPGVVKATVEEFLAAAEDSTIYELTGVITRMYRDNNENDTLYGNFYLKDATGEVLIYGLMDKSGNKYWEASGVKIGDTITVQTIRTSYNGTPQGKNATYISHTAGTGETPTPEPEPEPTPGDVVKATIAEFLAAAEGNTIYELTGVIKNVANTNYGNFDLQDATGTVYVYGIYDADGNKVFTSLGLKEGDTLTMRGVRTSYNDEPQVGSGVYVSHVVGEAPVQPANSATLSFTDVANRTVFTTEQQVWEQNGIKFTNDKGASTSNVADYSAPARFYKSSTIKVEGEKAITKIDFACNGGTYATALQESITTGTTTVDGSIVTVTLSTSATSYTVETLSAQVRMNSVTVYYAE